MAIKTAALWTVNKGLSKIGMRVLGPAEGPSFLDGRPSPQRLRSALFRRIAAKGFQPQHIIDVGAHRAGWSRDARDVWPGCRFTLLEPFADLAPDLDRFVAESPEGKAQWLQVGGGVEDATLTFTARPDAPDAGSFRYSADQVAEVGGVQTEVPVRSINSLCRGGLPTPDIVKIDAEGLDFEVLRGASDLYGKTEVFFVELPLFDFFPDRQSFHSLTQHMHDVGYEPYDITDMNRRPCDDALALIEVAFARTSGVLRDYHGWD